MNRRFTDEQIVGAIRGFIEDNGYPPTQPEVAAQLGDPTYQNLSRRYRSLEGRGLIEVVPFTERGVRLVEHVD